MSDSELPKGFVRSLSEANQDVVAEVLLSRLKTRARLERLARGSAWIKLGWFLPLAASVVFLGLDEDLSGYLPIIVIFLLFLIQGLATYLHSRIDAIYRLMRDDRRSNGFIVQGESDDRRDGG